MQKVRTFFIYFFVEKICFFVCLDYKVVCLIVMSTVLVFSMHGCWVCQYTPTHIFVYNVAVVGKAFRGSVVNM